ncbi:MAG: SCO family protein [Rhizobiales bacterium]|nr:SCO family protein [Hyphomicrobiales bacterium]
MLPAAAGAHSLESLQEQLFEKEQYFQIKNDPAPEFTLQDASGEPVKLADYRGKVVVLHFIFAGCPDVCPLHAERIARVQEMINITPMRDQVAFITITTDPKRDTPDVLSSYGQAHGLNEDNWTFLTSGPERAEDTTRKLAEQFGHTFTPAEDRLQIHSVVTHVIDREGMLRANFHGLGFEPTNLVLFINGLVNASVPHQEPQPPSIWERIRSIF